MYIYITHTSVSAWLFVILKDGIYILKQSAGTQTFRADHSERYRCCFRYCLPDIESGYADEEKRVVQIEFYKESDVQMNLTSVDLNLLYSMMLPMKDI